MGHTDLYFKIAGPSLHLCIPWMNKRRRRKNKEKRRMERGEGARPKQKQASMKLQNSFWEAEKDDTHTFFRFSEPRRKSSDPVTNSNVTKIKRKSTLCVLSCIQ